MLEIMQSLNRNLLSINHQVKDALATQQPVVALESTVIAHGLPRPENLRTVQKLEDIVREEGSTPATIAVLSGRLCGGLDRRQLEYLANGNEIRKLSTRDLAIAVSRKWDGATTVAATIWIAHRAGIQVFATGGIGGVHRGALPDVSADLRELGRTPMIVVCSGAKSVLDLRRRASGWRHTALPLWVTAATKCPHSMRVEVVCRLICAVIRPKKSHTYSRRNAIWELPAHC